MNATIHVTTHGKITAPPGCYLLPAGEVLQEGDMSLRIMGIWDKIPKAWASGKVTVTWAFTYARRIP